MSSNAISCRHKIISTSFHNGQCDLKNNNFYYRRFFIACDAEFYEIIIWNKDQKEESRTRDVRWVPCCVLTVMTTYPAVDDGRHRNAPTSNRPNRHRSISQFVVQRNEINVCCYRIAWALVRKVLLYSSHDKTTPNEANQRSTNTNTTTNERVRKQRRTTYVERRVGE